VRGGRAYIPAIWPGSNKPPVDTTDEHSDGGTAGKLGAVAVSGLGGRTRPSHAAGRPRGRVGARTKRDRKGLGGAAWLDADGTAAGVWVGLARCLEPCGLCVGRFVGGGGRQDISPVSRMGNQRDFRVGSIKSCHYEQSSPLNRLLSPLKVLSNWHPLSSQRASEQRSS
jgi:hypothetical protein